jgi:hypothetical protein
MNIGDLKRAISNPSLDDFSEVRVYCQQCWVDNMNSDGRKVEKIDVVDGVLVFNDPTRGG